MTNIPNIEDIRTARETIKPYAVETPLLESNVLNERVGGRIFIKPELLQRTGSFKFRGAYNRISQTDKSLFPGGVVACSSGNHAQGVAEAARIRGLPAAIVMPSDAPKIKAARTRRSGAEVIFYDRQTEDREQIALQLCQDRNADFIHPYDDPVLIAGQGTTGLEILEQMQGNSPDNVLVPCGGGGLIAGIGIAIKDKWPEARLYSVEPEAFDDYARSLDSGVRQVNQKGIQSISDALQVPTPGKLTFEINSKLLEGGLTVSDDDITRAIQFAFEELKLIVEPGGAVALAALLEGKLPIKGQSTVVVLTGGNIDRDTHIRLLSA